MAGEILPADALQRLQFLHAEYQVSGFDYLDHSPVTVTDEWASSTVSNSYKLLARYSTSNDLLVGSPLTRRHVKDAFDLVKTDSDSDINLQLLGEAFVLAMIWGFKPRAYGPWRTNEMLGNRQGEPGRSPTLPLLMTVLEALREGTSAVEGYRMLKGKIHRLGPAFATKFLYFATPEIRRAPILDSVVGKWLWAYGVRDPKGAWLNPVPWNVGNYQRYLNFCSEAANKLDIEDIGLIEYLMFADARFSDYQQAANSQPDWLMESGLGGWPSPT